MFRTKLLLILALVATVTVGQANRGYSYYGTSNVRDQRPQPIYGQRPTLLPRRPKPVTGPVTAAPEAPAPVPNRSSAPAAPPALATPSYAPVLRPQSPNTPVYRPRLPPRPIRLAPPAVAPPQPSAIGKPQPPVRATAPPLPPVEANTPEAPILPEPAVEQPEYAPMCIPASQPREPVVVETLPEPVPTGEPAPITEHPPAIRQPEATSYPEHIRKPEPIRQPEPNGQPEPTRQPEPEPQPEPAPQTKPVLQPEPVTQPKPNRESDSVQQPPSKPVTDLTMIRSNNVPQSPTPLALPPLLPKHQPVREPAFGQHYQPTVTPMIYSPTVTYPTQTFSNSYPPTPPRSVGTQAPPVVVTTQLHPVVTQALGQLKFDFQCKEGNGYYSVEHQCDTYIECKQNRAVKYTCPDGLHFNPAAKPFEYPCAYSSEVKCRPGDQEQNPKPTAKCPNQNGLYPMNNGECSQYIMCHEGLATIMNCPKGLVFNPQINNCDWPANVPQCNPIVFKDFTCPAPPEDEDGHVSDIIYKYRYERQCKLYIACQLGHPRLLSCERGLYFDDASQTCIEKDYVTDCLENLQ